MPPTADPRQRAFLWVNGAAAGLLVIAAILAWIGRSWRHPAGLAALVLVVVAIGAAVASYPYYRSWMRDEAAARRMRRSPARPGLRPRSGKDKAQR